MCVLVPLCPQCRLAVFMWAHDPQLLGHHRHWGGVGAAGTTWLPPWWGALNLCCEGQMRGFEGLMAGVSVRKSAVCIPCAECMPW